MPCDAGTICATCVEGTCNHDTGEGCSEGEGCYTVAGDPRTGALTTGCAASLARPVGAPCTSGTDCESGHICLVGPPSFCAPTCCGGRGCPEGMTCSTVNVVDADAGLSTPAPSFGACMWDVTLDCDAVRQTGCASGTACYPAPLLACLAPGALPAGAPCFDVAACAPGHACWPEGDGTATCRRLCRDARDCGGGPCERPDRPGGEPGLHAVCG